MFEWQLRWDFRSSSLFSFHNIVQSARLEEILPYLSVGCHRIIQTGTETRVSEKFVVKTGIKGWQLEEFMWVLLQNCFSCSHNVLLFSNQLIFTHASVLFLFFSLTFTPFIIFSCPTHPCMAFSRYVLVQFKQVCAVWRHIAMHQSLLGGSAAIAWHSARDSISNMTLQGHSRLMEEVTP